MSGRRKGVRYPFERFSSPSGRKKRVPDTLLPPETRDAHQVVFVRKLAGQQCPELVRRGGNKGTGVRSGFRRRDRDSLRDTCRRSIWCDSRGIDRNDDYGDRRVIWGSCGYRRLLCSWNVWTVRSIIQGSREIVCKMRPVMIFLLVLLFLLALGAVLVAYGTAVRNGWGINLDAVACPRCKTPLPRLYLARSVRQHLWGGWTCPVCGAGVDKWGREIAPIAKRTVVMPADEVRRVQTKRLIFITPVLFCVLMALDWTGLTGSGFPSSLAEAIFQVCANIVWTAALTGVSYFIMSCPFKRSLPKENGDDSSASRSSR